MVSATVLTSLLLAPAALAAPSLEASLQQRNAAAAAGQESSSIKYLGERDLFPGPPWVDLDKNWSGAIYNNTNNTFQSVTAAVTIPDFTNGTVSVWLGIDGLYCSAGFHTGLNLTVGQVTPWYRLYPDDSKPFSYSLSIQTGDVVRMTVAIILDHMGFVMIQNLNSTLAVIQEIFIPDGFLCRSEAMWFAAWDAPLANFDTILLTDVMANTTAGVNIGPDEPGYNVRLMNIAEEYITSTYVDESTRTITINHN